MQQSSGTPKNQEVGIVLWKIVAYSQPYLRCLLVAIVFGMVSSLHPTTFRLYDSGMDLCVRVRHNYTMASQVYSSVKMPHDIFAIWWPEGVI